MMSALQMMRNRRTSAKIVNVLTICVFLTGCAVPMSREARIGQDDPSDTCREFVVALDSTGNFFAEDMIKGAVAGGLAGAIVGAGTAAATGQNIGKGVAIGAVSGAVAGAGAAYWNSKMQQGREQAVLGLNQDLSRDLGEGEKARLASNKLYSCRMKQRDTLRADLKKGQIVKAEADKRWQIIQGWLVRDQKVLDNVSKNLDERIGNYNGALELAQTESAPAAEPTTASKPRSTPKPSNELQQATKSKSSLQDVSKDVKSTNTKLASLSNEGMVTMAPHPLLSWGGHSWNQSDYTTFSGGQWIDMCFTSSSKVEL